ncbi:MAG: hypothetical protein ACR2OF_00055 [Hyphomicrobium sp.]
MTDKPSELVRKVGLTIARGRHLKADGDVIARAAIQATLEELAKKAANNFAPPTAFVRKFAREAGIPLSQEQEGESDG